MTYNIYNKLSIVVSLKYVSKIGQWDKNQYILTTIYAYNNITIHIEPYTNYRLLNLGPRYIFLSMFKSSLKIKHLYYHKYKAKPANILQSLL